MGFENKGSIIFNKEKQKPWFDLFPKEDDQRGYVYLWIAVLGNQKPKILYIGKAGRGLKKRFNEHFGGFTHNRRGREIFDKLSTLIKKRATISIHAKCSKTKAFFGQARKFSLCDAEEQALIARFYKEHELYNIIPGTLKEILESEKEIKKKRRKS